MDDHLPAIVESDKLKLVGVVDIDEEKASKIGKDYGVEFDIDYRKFLNRSPGGVDAALVAVPHVGYLEIVRDLADRGIHIIKEKPFAASLRDAMEMKAAVETSNVLLRLTLQRRFNPIFRSFLQLIRRVGKLHSIEAKYVLNVERLDEGWRASRLFAGGGAIIDLGYHYIDLLIWYFGLPDTIHCKLSTGNRVGQTYDVEDTAFISFSYREARPDNERIIGNLIVSRVFPAKEESLTVYGTLGSVCVQRGKVTRVCSKGNLVESLERSGSWPSALIDQLEAFADEVHLKRSNKEKYVLDSTYLQHTAFVEAAYRSAANHVAVNPHDILSEMTVG